MKVLILTPDIYTRGGIARYTATLASALGELIGAGNVHVQPLLSTVGSSANIKYRVFNPVASRLSATSKLRFVRKSMWHGRRRYDLIICTHIGLAPVAGLINVIYGTPFWVTCHGREAWPPFPADVRWAVKRADLVLPISHFTEDTVARVNGVPVKKMRVLYNAIPEDFVRLLTDPSNVDGSVRPTDKRQRRILSVGMVTKENVYKGYDTVIKALPKVLQTVPSANYQIVGEGDDIDRLKRLASEMGVQDHVEFKGGIPDAELASCYRDCDVFVLPSRTVRHNGGWQGEGFGRVYVEAALAGRPVVGSCGGGAAEAVLHEQTGFLVDPESISDVADALNTLIHNPALATKMGLQGQKWALQNFTFGALSRRVSRLLTDYGP